MYIVYRHDQLAVTFEINKINGKILGQIHSDDKKFCTLSALDNKLAIAEQQDSSVVQVHVYDEKEKKSKTVEVPGKSVHYMIMAGPHYLLHSQRAKDHVQLVISDITKQKSNNEQQKIQEVKQKVLKLNGSENARIRFVWIPMSSSSESESGYVFISALDPSRDTPIAYEVNLARVEDGYALDPIEIKFDFQQQYHRILFLSALGNDSILCCLQRRHCFDKQLAIFKMKFY